MRSDSFIPSCHKGPQKIPHPPSASPCRRRKGCPWQLEALCPCPSLALHPHITHTTIIPDFYSSSSAILQILSTSQRPSCLTSPLLSPQVCVPKCQPSLCWLSLLSPSHGQEAGQHQTPSPAAGAKPNLPHPCFSLSGNCHKLAQNLSDVGITVSGVSPAVSVSNSVQQDEECCGLTPVPCSCFRIRRIRRKR